MDQTSSLELYSNILRKAKDLGASLVGIANVEDLKKAPSYTVAPMMQAYDGVGVNKEKVDNLKSGEVNWPEGAKSVIVIAYAHPDKKPELDYWYGSRDPIGNPSSGPTAFDPCSFCDKRCIRSCPQNSFREQIYTTQQFGREELPGRIGDYDRTI